jgi:hypothetical protein
MRRTREKPRSWEDLVGVLGESPARLHHLVGLSRGAMYTACERGEIKSHRFGSRVVVDVPALLEQFGVKMNPEP